MVFSSVLTVKHLAICWSWLQVNVFLIYPSILQTFLNDPLDLKSVADISPVFRRVSVM